MRVCLFAYPLLLQKFTVREFVFIMQLVDHVMVEEFIENNYPIKWDHGIRRAMTDAHNFHNAMDACRTANLKQWERKKKLNKINESVK